MWVCFARKSKAVGVRIGIKGLQAIQALWLPKLINPLSAAEPVSDRLIAHLLQVHELWGRIPSRSGALSKLQPVFGGHLALFFASRSVVQETGRPVEAKLLSLPCASFDWFRLFRLMSVPVGLRLQGRGLGFGPVNLSLKLPSLWIEAGVGWKRLPSSGFTEPLFFIKRPPQPLNRGLLLERSDLARVSYPQARGQGRSVGAALGGSEAQGDKRRVLVSVPGEPGWPPTRLPQERAGRRLKRRIKRWIGRRMSSLSFMRSRARSGTEFDSERPVASGSATPVYEEPSPGGVEEEFLERLYFSAPPYVDLESFQWDEKHLDEAVEEEGLDDTLLNDPLPFYPEATQSLKSVSIGPSASPALEIAPGLIAAGRQDGSGTDFGEEDLARRLCEGLLPEDGEEELRWPRRFWDKKLAEGSLARFHPDVVEALKRLPGRPLVSPVIWLVKGDSGRTPLHMVVEEVQSTELLIKILEHLKSHPPQVTPEALEGNRCLKDRAEEVLEVCFPKEKFFYPLGGVKDADGQILIHKLADNRAGPAELKGVLECFVRILGAGERLQDLVLARGSRRKTWPGADRCWPPAGVFEVKDELGRGFEHLSGSNAYWPAATGLVEPELSEAFGSYRGKVSLPQALWSAQCLGQAKEGVNGFGGGAGLPLQARLRHVLLAFQELFDAWPGDFKRQKGLQERWQPRLPRFSLMAFKKVQGWNQERWFWVLEGFNEGRAECRAFGSMLLHSPPFGSDRSLVDFLLFGEVTPFIQDALEMLGVRPSFEQGRDVEAWLGQQALGKWLDDSSRLASLKALEGLWEEGVECGSRLREKCLKGVFRPKALSLFENPDGQIRLAAETSGGLGQVEDANPGTIERERRPDGKRTVPFLKPLGDDNCDWAGAVQPVGQAHKDLRDEAQTGATSRAPKARPSDREGDGLQPGQARGKSQDKVPSDKQRLWILIGVVGLAALGGGVYWHKRRLALRRRAFPPPRGPSSDKDSRGTPKKPGKKAGRVGRKPPYQQPTKGFQSKSLNFTHSTRSKFSLGDECRRSVRDSVSGRGRPRRDKGGNRV